MKPQPSAITTSQKEQPSKIGTPLGGHGLATRAASGQSATTLPARSYAQSLGQRERFDHRAWIGLRVEAMLDGYWSSRPIDEVRQIILTDWMDALEDFAPAEIEKACKEYMSGPDRARKPKTGDILDLMVAFRAELRRALPKPPEPPSPVLSIPQEERRRQAEAIMARFRGGADGQV